MSHTQSGHDGGAGGYGEGKDPGSVPPDQNTAELWQRLVQECRTTDFTTFKHQLPLARIKKIMKSDSDVHMISAEAPLLFSKACELFILDLTLRAWRHAEMNNHKTLGKEDIADAITDSYMFDFLADVSSHLSFLLPPSPPPLLSLSPSLLSLLFVPHLTHTAIHTNQCPIHHFTSTFPFFSGLYCRLLRRMKSKMILQLLHIRKMARGQQQEEVLVDQCIVVGPWNQPRVVGWMTEAMTMMVVTMKVRTVVAI